jgi:hypothetical protein
MMSFQDHLTAEYGDFIGKRLIGVRPLMGEELAELGWEWAREGEAFVLMFHDGSCLIPSQDPEGNGPGFLLTGDLSV